MEDYNPDQDPDPSRQTASPIGSLNIIVFESAQDPNIHACYLTTDTLMTASLDPWLEAAACLMSQTAKISSEGFEKTIELITEKAMKYRENSSSK